METKKNSIIPTEKSFYKNLFMWWALLAMVSTVIATIFTGAQPIGSLVEAAILIFLIGSAIGFISEVIHRRRIKKYLAKK